jgi:hypothetical protein
MFLILSFGYRDAVGVALAEDNASGEFIFRCIQIATGIVAA